MTLVPFGDNCLITKPEKPIDVSTLGFFDVLEYDCWALIKSYARAFNLRIEGKDELTGVSWDLAKEVQETIINIFKDAGIEFNHNSGEEDMI